ncbi:alpha/beta hydrolase [Arcanobacterium ihumii]|uniref:alpha/beta hydrolase n=1 Tax=Arcanobacterium ihumii TaxID=2138162 RepID=UPI000F529413|nr:alpha/beta hydrolase-fold protein [Arcanobacterium ihumii]
MNFFELIDDSTFIASIIILAASIIWTTVALPYLWERRIRKVAMVQEYGQESSPRSQSTQRFRLGMRKAGRFLAHFLSLILCCLLAIWTAFIGFNRSTLWYATWDDLFGQLDQQVEVQDIGGGDPTEGNKGETSHPQPKQTHSPFTKLQTESLSNPALPGITESKQGQWIKTNIDGQGARGDGTTYIYLPPSYLASSNRAYPVVVAFQGVPGSPAGFTEIMHTAEKYQEAVGKKEVGEAIIVAPTVFPKNLDTECRDVPGATIETWVTTTMRSWVQTNLRTNNSRDSWAVDGYSAGGWCSAMFAMKHTDIFGAGIVRSGYFAPDYTKGVQWDNPNNPAYLLAEVAKGAPDTRLFVLVGKKDGTKRASYDAFKQALKAPTTLTEFEVGGSSHRWDVWVNSQARSYAWLGKTLAGFKYSE